MSLIPTIEPKAPGEKLFYAVDWTDELAERPLKPAETISQSAWEASGVEIEQTTVQDLFTLFWATAGALDTDAFVTSKITTSLGRELEQSVRIPIRRR